MSDSRWNAPETVAGFAQSPPNAVLMRVAADRVQHAAGGCAIDLGCGAGRNAIPLARLGWRVLGVDLSMAMLGAAAARARSDQAGARVHLALAPMDALPAAGRSVDLVVAHGIWNLARSGAEFRRAVGEAARVARPGATLFVFTFSRHTLPPETEPVAGETFVFTQFAGEPQCFLSEEQLVDELMFVGFAPDASSPLRELNRPAPGSLPVMPAPVIFEGVFRRITQT